MPTHVLELVALLSCGLAGFTLALAAPRTDTWNRTRERYVAQVESDLRYLQLDLTGAQLLQRQQWASAALFAIAAFATTPWPLLLIAATWSVPRTVLARRRLARTTAIDLQLDAWLVSLAHGLRATPALGDAIASSADLLAEPLASELRLVLKESALGVPLDRALDAMGDRVKSPVVTTALATLRIARSAGGDVARTLEVSAASLREMARLEGTVRTKTAEGRAQAAVIAIIPIPLFLGLNALDPDFLAPVWTTTKGHGLLAIACVLWAGSILAARRIVAVDI